MASAVGLAVNMVPAEGSYVLKQLDDGTTVLLDAMTFLNHVSGPLVLNTAPAGTDLLTHSVFGGATVQTLDATHQLVQVTELQEPEADQVPLEEEERPQSAEPHLSAVEVLLAEAGELTGHRRPEELATDPPPPQPPDPQQAKLGRKIGRLYPPEPPQEPPGPAPWPCPKCGRKFSAWKRYLNHVNTHDYEKPFKCTECSETFNFEQNLRLHVVTHSAAASELVCPDCGRKFRRLASFRSHLAVHSVDDGLVCPQCQHEFQTQALLDKHLPVHDAPAITFSTVPAPRVDCLADAAAEALADTPEMVLLRPLPDAHHCDQCKTVFHTAAELQEHARQHKTVQSLLTVQRRRRRGSRGAAGGVFRRRPSCNICFKTFAKPAILARHMLIHTGERPFKCELCDRAFNQKNALKIHKDSKHGKLRPHSCQLCRLTFAQKGNLRNHVRRVHNLSEAHQRSHVCPQCGCGFASAGVLSSHISKMHERAPGAEIGADALRDLVRQLVEYSAANEAARARIHAQLADITGATVDDDELPSVLSGLVEALQRGETAAAALAAAGATTLATSVDTGGEKVAPAPAVVVQQQPQLPVEDDVQVQESTEQPAPVSTGAAPPSSDRTAPPAIAPMPPAEPPPPTEPPSPVDPPPPLPPPPEPVPARNQPAIITIVDKVGWADGTRRAWANSDGDPGIGEGAQQQGRKYLVRVRYEGRRRWFQCLFCTKEFRKPYDLVRHLRIHTKDRPFKCAQCHRTFTVRSGLEAHMRVHRGIKTASCPICQKKFATASVLRVHLRLHTGAKPYSCQFCQKTFRTLGNRNAHESFHRAGHLDENGTDVRKRKQTMATSFVDVQLEPPIHITDDGSLVQEDKRRGLSAIGDGALSEDRPHRCSVCHVAFKKVSHMRQHMRQHTGERPHRCRFCEKGFITASALTSHERTHTGARFYKCPICFSAFTTGSSLKRHMSTHTEDRPYMCPYCHRRFKTRMICKKHTRTHKAELAGGLQIQPDPDGSAVDGGGGGAALFPGLIEASAEEDQLLEDGGGYATQAQNVSVIVDQHGRMVQCELAPGQAQTLTANPDGTVSISELAPSDQTDAQGSLNVQLSDGQIFTTADLAAAGLTRADQPTADATEEQTLLLAANMADIQTTDEQPAPDEADAMEPAAGAHGDIDSDDDEALRLRNEQHGQMILEMDSDNVLLQDPSLSQPLIHRCRVCKKMFTTQLALKRHEEIHTIRGEMTLSAEAPVAVPAADQPPPSSQPGRPSEVHLCIQCLTVFSSADQLTAHRASHEPPAPLPESQPPPPPEPAPQPQSRPQPESQAQTEDGAEGEVVGEEDAEPAVDRCKVCGASFLDATSLKKHVAREHGKMSRKKSRPVIRLSDKLTARLAEQPLSVSRSQAEICLIQSAVEKVQNGPVQLRTESEEAGTEPQLKHRCKECSKAFRKPSDLVRHVRIHTGEKPFCCEICLKRFTVKSTLLGHLRTHSGQRDFQCLVCKARFATKCSLRVHSRLHTGARPYHCEVCGRAFRTSGHRSTHMAVHGWKGGHRPTAQDGDATDGEAQNGEPKDGEATSEPAARGRQTLSAQLQGVLHELTAESAGRKGARGRPRAQRADDEDEDDPDDPDASAQPVQPEPDPAEEEPEEPTQEEQVQEGGEGEGVEVEGEESVLHLEPGLVEQLQLVLASQAPGAGDTELRVHLQIDADGRIVGVEAAPSTTETAAAATLAIREEPPQPLRPDREQARTLRQVVAGALREGDISGGGVMRCSVCGRGFHSRGQWRRHMRGHGIEAAPDRTAAGTGRTYTCNVCRSVFNTSSLLSRHRRTHTGERPYQCDQCDRAFAQKNTLQAHMRTHLGERPHTCPFCGHGFAQKGNMRTHIRRAHLKSALDSLELDAQAAEGSGQA